MSGPKEADVQLSVSRAIEAIEKQVRESRSFERALSNLGEREADSARTAAETAATLPGFNDESRKFASQEIRSLGDSVTGLRSGIAGGDSLLAEARKLKKNADDLHSKAQGNLQEARRKCDSATRGVQSPGLSNLFTGFTGEYAAAEEARGLAREALRLESQAVEALNKAADKFRKARNSFDGTASRGGHLQAEARRVADIVQQRRETARIAEENERKAKASHQDCLSVRQHIERLNHAKFAPGEFDPVRKALDGLAVDFSKSNYPAFNSRVCPVLDQANALLAKVSKAQSDWEATKRAAENDLETVGKELAAFDRAFVAKWSGSGDGVDAIFDKVNQARERIAAEEFQVGQELLAAALTEGRAALETATTNRRKFDQREVISEAVMNALCEQGYDAPSFYFNAKDRKGNEDELSDLTIFAKSPGKLGDMRMKIDLDGKVNLELEAVPEGQESECVNILNGLRDRLAGEVDFQMTDWGRAEGDAGKAREIHVAQVKEQEKRRERQGG